MVSTFLWIVLDTILLSNAEGPEDEIEDVVGGGGAGYFVEGTQGSVEIEQQHLVRNAGGYGVAGGSERAERVVHPFLMANAGEEAGFGVLRRVARDVTQDGFAQRGYAIAGQGGGTDSWRRVLRRRRNTARLRSTGKGESPVSKRAPEVGFVFYYDCVTAYYQT